MSQGKLFLVPTYLSGNNDASFISPTVSDVIKHCNYYFVENIRTARRFIGSLKTGVIIDSIEFYLLNKSSQWDDLYSQFEPIRKGQDMAVMSEAGLPCLADPGNLAVTFAHQNQIRVVPLPGASSIQLALVASGFNGQKFSFNGYLPIDKSERKQKIKELEKVSAKGITQLFMETPYRNQQLLNDILQSCRPDTFLSIASDITGMDEMILTQSINKWKTTKVNIHKIPTIFSFGQFA